uniref:Transcriptional repressor OPI1 n=1 Tax=Talaromyces marneffei PM1 TaxID=1077442 RepID=A0A093VY53_TALMA
MPAMPAMLAVVKSVAAAMPGFVAEAIPVLKNVLEFLTLVKDILDVVKDIVGIIKAIRGQQPQWGQQIPQSSALLRELFYFIILLCSVRVQFPVCFEGDGGLKGVTWEGSGSSSSLLFVAKNQISTLSSIA